jgi:uncharacterized membrane protein
MATLFQLFVWCEQTGLGTAVRNSTWMFPVIEIVHILAFGALGGAVLLVDLRALGFALPEVAVRQLSDGARPVLNLALVAITVSGVLLFLSEATKCYGNPAFWLKMGLFVLAILFTATVRRRRLADEQGAESDRPGRLVALISLTLWFGVGTAGRGIGFW